MHSFIQNHLLLLEVQSFSQLFCYCLSKAKRNQKSKDCIICVCQTNWIPLLARITNLYMAGRLANLLKKNSAYSFSEQ